MITEMISHDRQLFQSPGFSSINRDPDDDITYKGFCKFVSFHLFIVLGHLTIFNVVQIKMESLDDQFRFSGIV